VGSKDRIPEAIRVHNLLRFERVSCLQAFGVKNMETFSGKDKADAPDQAQKPQQPRVPHIGRWIIEHDPEQYVIENYELARKHLFEGAKFRNTNTPPGLEYKPWTIDGLLEAQRRGEPTVLDGDWD
jgi:hypothetical protein